MICKQLEGRRSRFNWSRELVVRFEERDDEFGESFL